MTQGSINPQELRQIVRQEVAAALRELAARLDPGTPGRSAPPATSGPDIPAGKLNPKLIAVLTAAAVAALKRPVRVQRVTFLNQNTISAWSSMGRVAIQGSHNIRRSL